MHYLSMPATSPPDQRVDRVRKRITNACIRCRRHKIRCSGSQPCSTCRRRGVDCQFSERQRYTQDYVRELERRVNASAVEQTPLTPTGNASVSEVGVQSPVSRSTGQPAGHHDNDRQASSRASADQENVNKFALGQPVFVADSQGRPIYMGTSSSWAFGRRVLMIAHEHILGRPLSAENLLFPGKTYDLGWNGERDSAPAFDTGLLPQADYAMYLINAVKFHVGQIFHLFEEDVFMEMFRRLHEDFTCNNNSLRSSMWFKHYLLLLAFGKEFVARGGASHRPSGLEFFVQATATLPDLLFAEQDPYEELEILSCAALYLHSLDCRGAAYRMIGDALRKALDNGLHTDMQDQRISEPRKERARKIWWTVHLLDRQMSCLQGLPLALRDEDITARLPSYSGSSQKVAVLEAHIKLSQVMAMIVNNIYGKDGRLSNRFLVHTKAALQSLATINEHINTFPLGRPENSISRVTAYLHLLQHECIIMAIRPIIFHFFEHRLARLGQYARLSPPNSIESLLLMCKDSALQAFNILRALKKQDLIEHFLPFDLDAIYTSAIILLILGHLDPPVLDNSTQSMKIAHELLDQIGSRGNCIARALDSELQQLEEVVARMPPAIDIQFATEADGTRASIEMTQESHATYSGQSAWSEDYALWQNSISAEQMNDIANAVDLDGMNWWFDLSSISTNLDPSLA
ncbi:putative transcriptional regulatory protein C3C7.04 [Pseudocercospora fuligena]|uniref:Putative transcriptional regulatory protein C3C7.04 n=1 Tax=Pseudocercospora fuligena TaxID=685502 RepID=A0A8H6RDF0_9PEZI|nr:putative transcriptional regulatory protein C3C7.04 [Pseudocercospora fuligena]